MSFDISLSSVLLPSLLFLMGLIVVTGIMGGLWVAQRARLPYATRYVDVAEKLAIADASLREKREALTELDRRMTQRDFLIAEISGMTEQRDALQAELANLDSARKEIEAVKSEAAAIAAEYATAVQKRDAIQDEWQKMTAAIEGWQKELAQLETKIQTVREDKIRLSDEKQHIEAQLEPLRIERDAALRVMEEARTAQTKIEQLSQRLEDVRGDIEASRETKTQLQQEIATMERDRAEVGRLRERAAELSEDITRNEATLAALETTIAEAEAELGEFATKIDEKTTVVDRLKAEIQDLERINAEVSKLRNRASELSTEVNRDEARLASLEIAIDAARKELDDLKTRVSDSSAGGSEPIVDEEKLLDDLTRQPACLTNPVVLRRAQRTESEALGQVTRYLADLGLKYDPRTVFAFHTALKINDKSQMTVLAGVSGTGKSLLPRRYAEAMGIHFLQIAVEPRWDSPQDLLGFYNYIEKRYRATDLARLLVHMDPYDASKLLSTRPQDRRNHMSMVLLDEMNLARVEYYFSEFLSRLEARPPYSETGEALKRRDAMIPMDIRGLKRPISLFPSHNILFAGTMNDDESTQALSDKVLDRGNVMQFAAPRSFETAAATGQATPVVEAQPFDHWRGWVKPEDAIRGADKDTARRTVEALAQIMQKVGRPFGHRLRDAILAYVANYPKDGPMAADVRAPLVDQIEFRIMPKLRGVEIDAGSHREAFEDLVNLIRDDLNDAQFSQGLETLLEQQRRSSGLFLWRGFARAS